MAYAGAGHRPVGGRLRHRLPTLGDGVIDDAVSSLVSCWEEGLG
jgi:hypothetical protein